MHHARRDAQQSPRAAEVSVRPPDGRPRVDQQHNSLVAASESLPHMPGTRRAPGSEKYHPQPSPSRGDKRRKISIAQRNTARTQEKTRLNKNRKKREKMALFPNRWYVPLYNTVNATSRNTHWTDFQSSSTARIVSASKRSASNRSYLGESSAIHARHTYTPIGLRRPPRPTARSMFRHAVGTP